MPEWQKFVNYNDASNIFGSLCTNVALSDSKIVRIYGNRCFFKASESFMKLDTEFQCRSYRDRVSTYKVTSVANNAFSGNKKITTVTIGKNVTSIGKNAFKNCTKLKSVDIKSTTLNKIGANVFNRDKKLTRITLKTTKLTKNSVGKNALKGTNKNLVVKVPKKKVSAYKKYFTGKGNKTVKVTK